MNTTHVAAVVVCLFSLLFVTDVCVAQTYSVNIINNVAPCANGNYSTISLFITPAQVVLAQGLTYLVQSSQISVDTGLGIQENGQYCRSHGDEAGCINPDNAGMQLWVTTGNCSSFTLDDPFYCGKYPPNAKTIVNVVMSGTWPACVATLTRLPNAPLCQYTCTSTITTTSSSSGASSSPSTSSSTASGTGASSTASGTHTTSSSSTGSSTSTTSKITTSTTSHTSFGNIMQVNQMFILFAVLFYLLLLH